MAMVDVSGVEREASVMMTPEVKVGDYIIMHAGFAIHILDVKEAEETLRLLEEIAASGTGHRQNRQRLAANGLQPTANS